MGARIHFTPQLKDWILHNIDRGIPPAPLVSNMVEQGFDPQIAGTLVHTVWSARATGAPIPDGAIEAEQIEAAVYRHEPSRLSAGNAIATDDGNIRVAMRLAQPVLAVLDNVLSPGECDRLIALAVQRLMPSTIVDPGTGMDIDRKSVV